MNGFGRDLRLSIFGSSHGPALGCMLDGLPSGMKVDEGLLREEMELRRPKQGIGTPRKEEDEVEIVAGVADGVTTGSPVTLLIRNNDVDSSKYEKFRRLPRPGHADLPAMVKYPGHDLRGGGQFSGRMTAVLVAAGALTRPLLEANDVHVGAFSRSIGSVTDREARTVDDARGSRSRNTRACDDELDTMMRRDIEMAASSLDSVGGVVECLTEGLPIGVGEPWFDGLEAYLGHAVFSIPAVKGLEFGDGFRCAARRGSENNDPFRFRNGSIVTLRNSHGGSLGGLSTGMPLVFRAAFKPTPSIGIEQGTVDLEKREDSTLTIEGRHDPCIVPRAVPVVEAVTVLALTDLMMRGGFIGP